MAAVVSGALSARISLPLSSYCAGVPLAELRKVWATSETIFHVPSRNSSTKTFFNVLTFKGLSPLWGFLMKLQMSSWGTP